MYQTRFEGEEMSNISEAVKRLLEHARDVELSEYNENYCQESFDVLSPAEILSDDDKLLVERILSNLITDVKRLERS